MPFDPTDYTPPQPPPPGPGGRRLSPKEEAILLRIVLIFALTALLFPISADGVVDIWRYSSGP